MPHIAERLLRLLSLLSAGHSWSGDDLAERLGVTARTVLIALHLAMTGIAFTPLDPPELRERCAELARRLAQAAGEAAEAERAGAEGHGAFGVNGM